MPRSWWWPENPGDMAWRRHIIRCFYPRNLVLRIGIFVLPFDISVEYPFKKKSAKCASMKKCSSSQILRVQPAAIRREESRAHGVKPHYLRNKGSPSRERRANDIQRDPRWRNPSKWLQARNQLWLQNRRLVRTPVLQPNLVAGLQLVFKNVSLSVGWLKLG